MTTFQQTSNIPTYAQNMLSGLQEITQQWQTVVSTNFHNMEGEWQGLAFEAAGTTFTQMDTDMKTYIQELEMFCQNVIKFHGDTSQLDQLGQRMLQAQ